MPRTRILILGANGMLGHKLLQVLSAYETFEVFGTIRSPDPALQRYYGAQYKRKIFENIDAQYIDAIYQVVETCRPQVIINCIGIIKQSEAAQKPLTCIYTNALLPHRLSLLCRLTRTRLIHVSTDCVFDGTKGHYSEQDLPCPVDLYGRTKLIGELDEEHSLTLRTSIIGHELSGRKGLIEWFLAQKEPIKGFANHIYSGFPTVVLANILAKYIIPFPDLHGIYQLSSQPISKYELLQLVARQYQKNIVIEPDDSSFCDRSMNSDRLQAAIHYQPPSWEHLVEQMYEDYRQTPQGVYP